MCWKLAADVRGADDLSEFDGTNAREVAAVDMATMHEREIFMMSNPFVLRVMERRRMGGGIRLPELRAALTGRELD